MKAIITGATRGIGKAVASSLASRGYELGCAARSQSDLDELKNELIELGSSNVVCEAVDFSNKDEARNFGEKMLREMGSVDVIVNNVGGYSMGKIEEEGTETLEKLMALNFYSAYFTTLPFIAEFRKKGSGHIFNICSIVNKNPRTDAPAYTITKSALDAFTKVLCKDLHAAGAKVTAIYPGSVNTSSWEGIEAPKDEFVQPEDIAGTIINILDASSGALFEEVVIRPVNNKF